MSHTIGEKAVWWEVHGTDGYERRFATEEAARQWFAAQPVMQNIESYLVKSESEIIDVKPQARKGV